MPLVVGIRFKTATKVYYFGPGKLQDLQVGDHVVVETARARELARIVVPQKEVDQSEIVGKLKPVLRKATSLDLSGAQFYSGQTDEALEKCREKVAEHGLPIKVLAAEYNFDGSHLVFSFTAEKRVDFRALVRELARLFHTRIELRQVGVRDEAKIIEGIGPCGRQLCCCTHLCEFIPVSIKMAKQQGLPLSPMEISGMCGRLLCCLTYENDYYRDAAAKMRRVGDRVRTPDGAGVVTGRNLLKETVNVQLQSGATIEVSLAQLKPDKRTGKKESRR
jgi:cell fate regulator YaaT (PSP1 superfamily)